VEAVDHPLLVLLLPRRLERFELEVQARELLAEPGAVAVDPARLPLARLPAALAAGLAVGQAKRMRLPGPAAAVAIFHPLQFYLAGALLARHPMAELWYGEPELDAERAAASARARARLEQLHAAAALRAALRFSAGPELDLGRLRARMAELGIPAGLSAPPSPGEA
jgi:hypothetical protein